MLILYSTAIFLSAFLLFLVQPMVGKMILPIAGGSASAWINCLFFFQTVLLAGYAYAHFSTRTLGSKFQARLHLLLAAIAILWLPISFAQTTAAVESPSYWILKALTSNVAMPFFILAALSPIIQMWFSNTGHARSNNPFFLFASSNLGSFVALIVYPTLIETHLNLEQQSNLWKFLFIFLLLLLSALYLSIRWQSTDTETAKADAEDNSPISSSWQPWRWIIAAMLPSGMLLAVTRFITTDIAPFPLLWIIPLLIYLATFVSAFSQFRLPAAVVKLMLLAAIMIFPPLYFYFTTYLAFSVPAHLFILLAISLYCHTWLADNRPPLNSLTAFYLFISLGGVMGSLFVSIIAPVVFNNDAEYSLLIIAACYLIRHFPLNSGLPEKLPEEHLSLSIAFGIYAATAVIVINVLNVPLMIQQNAIASGIGATGKLTARIIVLLTDYNQPVKALLMTLFAVFPIYFMKKMPAINLPMLSLSCIGVLAAWHIGNSPAQIFAARNFYGTKVVQMSTQEKTISLVHGSTSHGTQSMLLGKMHEPLAYFHPAGPAGSIFARRHMRKKDLKGAFIGLGIGTMLAYSRPGQFFTFFEIDPQVIQIAKNPDFFTFVSSFPDRHRIVAGDGRREIMKSADSSFDIIFIDAFSSDSIPVHLITSEAVNMYLKKLKDDGLIVVHITNRYINLKPMLRMLALEAECHIISSLDNAFDPSLKTNAGRSISEYVVISRNDALTEEFLTCQQTKWQKIMPGEKESNISIWRDNQSSIFPLLNL